MEEKRRGQNGRERMRLVWLAAGSVDVTPDRIVPVKLHGDKRATGNQPLLASSDLSPTAI